MAYPEDLVGNAIHLPTPNPGQIQKNICAVLDGYGGNITVNVYRFVLPRPTPPGAPPGTVLVRQTPLTNLNAPWFITFLLYAPGEVSAVTMLRPVLTGPMSGCYLFRYQEGGSTRIAHVGSADASQDPSLNLLARNTWVSYIERMGLTEIKGESPHALYQQSERESARVEHGSMGVVYGLFLPDGRSFSVLVANLPSIHCQGQTNMAMIRAVKPMPLLAWDFVKSTRNFK